MRIFSMLILFITLILGGIHIPISEYCRDQENFNFSNSQELQQGANICAVSLDSRSLSGNDSEVSRQWGIRKIRADRVWNEGFCGDGVIVATIDTGIDLKHPDFISQNESNIVSGYNAITKSELPCAVQDDNGHGTSVAGVIAALRNDRGIVGIAYHAKIMPIKVMDQNGEGQDEVIADGIVWAVDHGAKIINMSIEDAKKAKVLEEAIQYASDKDCILIAAAGNKSGYITQSIENDTGTQKGVVTYPASNPNVIAVSSIDATDKISGFSLYGSEVLLSAPGDKIYTDYLSEKGSEYISKSGTSFAAPMVAGAAALLWSNFPQLSASDIRQALVESAYDLGGEGRDDQYGFGRIDVYRAFKKLQRPKEYTSPASLDWEGGSVLSGNTIDDSKVILTVLPGTFPLQVNPDGLDKRVIVSLSETYANHNFPEGIIPASDLFDLRWDQDVSQKLLTVEIKLQPAKPITMKARKYIAYLYEWSNPRWIRIGGGVPETSDIIKVSLYEQGIYRVGWSPEPEINRIAGVDRIHTALEIAKQAFPTGADSVILTRSDNFPDALAAAPLAYKYHAPILLTNPQVLHADIEKICRDFQPKNIYILGGEEAVGYDIERQLLSIAPVQRIAGSDRYATAAAIAKTLGTKGQAVVVNSNDFPDAIAAASHASYQGKPILLTSSDFLNQETQAILRKLAVTKTEVIGGREVLDDQVFSLLINPKRLGGKDRFDTSSKLINQEKPEGRIYFLATGMEFPDALTGGVLASCNRSNIILLSPIGPTPDQTAFLSDTKSKRIIALGGQDAVPDDILQRINGLVKSLHDE
ncbi:MAG: Subtilisin DY [Candidatus Dichloromethanomonas elyunquensis]|nr:MAG: Subtilisin DY [Candidatus Dichloromethanomonas elyunquensis]